jgi:hypothetical protein
VKPKHNTYVYNESVSSTLLSASTQPPPRPTALLGKSSIPILSTTPTPPDSEVTVSPTAKPWPFLRLRTLILRCVFTSPGVIPFNAS